MLRVVKPHLWPQIKILFSRGHESRCRTRLTAAASHFFVSSLAYFLYICYVNIDAQLLSQDTEVLFWAGLFEGRLSLQVEEGTLSDSPGEDHRCRELCPPHAQTYRTCLTWHLARLAGTPVSHLLKQLEPLRTALHAEQALASHVDLEWSWKVRD